MIPQVLLHEALVRQVRGLAQARSALAVRHGDLLQGLSLDLWRVSYG